MRSQAGPPPRAAPGRCAAPARRRRLTRMPRPAGTTRASSAARSGFAVGARVAPAPLRRSHRAAVAVRAAVSAEPAAAEATKVWQIKYDASKVRLPTNVALR